MRRPGLLSVIGGEELLERLGEHLEHLQREVGELRPRVAGERAQQRVDEAARPRVQPQRRGGRRVAPERLRHVDHEQCRVVHQVGEQRLRLGLERGVGRGDEDAEGEVGEQRLLLEQQGLALGRLGLPQR
jgi:hypothetical protein